MTSGLLVIWRVYFRKSSKNSASEFLTLSSASSLSENAFCILFCDAGKIRICLLALFGCANRLKLFSFSVCYLNSREPALGFFAVAGLSHRQFHMDFHLRYLFESVR